MRILNIGNIGARLRRSGRRERGQGLVEFALVAPLLLVLLLGIVDFARAWSAYEVITYAARMGARMAVVDNPSTTKADVIAAIENSLGRGSLDPTEATIEVNGFRAGRGTPAEVLIDYPYSLTFVGNFFNFVSGSSDLVLRTEFVMRNE